jgi:hypothetical protein
LIPIFYYFCFSIYKNEKVFAEGLKMVKDPHSVFLQLQHFFSHSLSLYASPFDPVDGHPAQ